MNDIADLIRRLESLIRLGTIAEIDLAANPPAVRVQSGLLCTDWLPWCTGRAGQSSDWNPPSLGEQVVLLCPSGDPASGVALLALYSSQHPPPSRDPNEHVSQYPDGARLSYNYSSGALSASGVQTARLQASKRVLIDCPETEISGNLTIKGKLTVLQDVLLNAKAMVMGLFSYQSGMAGSGGDDGAITDIKGMIRHSDGQLSSNGVVLDAHKHPDPHGGTTGDPI